ncbi:RNA-directed RNA polymerase QDE-1 [Aspergillus steynii IBT 23096]|uniref:RNA-dependent RNA polymerase n=1 Tax=Aspergillus steynii IBT 23096 TaxID=1392250 RepID=A0A2I2FTY3_9EURO|nr:RNA-directed RNA polymerase QDE-1 [Aspergillus steynii IBT 23096]PLB44105.1 RNA-directed RNA polymerase QDE-1 [Aspergillus steynii IBT 23096]
MEVFVRNIPCQLSRDGFKRELDPLMERLQIVDFMCDKPRSKYFGFITFLRQDDGHRFLAAHGQDEIPEGFLGLPRLRPRLSLMGVNIFCKLGDREPNPLILRALEHEVEERRKRLGIKPETIISFAMTMVSCGRSDFVRERLVYTPEEAWKMKGIIKFRKRDIVVKTASRIIRMPLVTVVGMVCSRDGVLTMTLSDVPFFFEYETHKEKNRCCALSSEHAKIVGQCLVYQFHVSTDGFHEKTEQLKEWDMTVIRSEIITAAVPTQREAKLSSQLQVLREVLGTYTQRALLPYGVLYQLQALAYNAYLHPSTIISLTREIYQSTMKDKETGRVSVSVDALKKLMEMIGWPFPHENPRNFEVGTLIEQLKNNQIQIQMNLSYRYGLFKPTANLARINRVTVTPTRITLNGPEVEPMNRILRKFPNHHEYFIRVQFCDENGQDLFFSSSVNYDNVFQRFKEVVTHGIQIAGRTFTFLGFSHSSLRSHSVWFSSPFIDHTDRLQTYFNIINALGNFSAITTPAKCAARIGQAFSETPYAISLPENEIQLSNIPDVKSADGSRVFSDGIGRLSRQVMELIWATVPESKGTPTCFQIRMGGAKGMLVLDDCLLGSKIEMRPSMIKFDSRDMHSLEICKMSSQPHSLVLNRQLIKILEDMGAPWSWFMDLQGDALRQIRSVTTSVDKTATFLRDKATADTIKLYRLFRQCYWLNLDYRKDPFLRSLVEHVVMRELRLLKHKARIPVSKGMTLYGVMDETGYLKEGEVYVTYDTMEGQYAWPPPAGKLLVTRSPALHDGDVQFAINTIPPDGHPLRSLKNCIVFSQKGERDLPSQLSGGDLDGDLYHVIWDNALIPTLRAFAPADYPRVQPVDIKRTVTVDDMANFFVDFMKTDHLGIIATKHMILADQQKLGTRDFLCRKLAELHSTAVDFSKTGIPVNMREIPRMNNFRPDFLAPGPRVSLQGKTRMNFEELVSHPAYNDEDDLDERRLYYRSEKILGKLYRAVDEKDIWYGDIRSECKLDEGPFWNDFIRDCTVRCNTVGRGSCRRLSGEASRIRAAYEDAIIGAMNNYSDHPTKPITELEVVTGCLMSETGMVSRRQRDRSIKLKDEYSRICEWITNQMRRQGPGYEYGTQNTSDGLELCLACVHEGMELGTARRSYFYRDLNSFKVVAVCALLAEMDVAGLFPRTK